MPEGNRQPCLAQFRRELFEVVGSVLARQLAADADFQPPIQLAVVPAQAAEHHLIAEALRVVRALHLKGTDFQRIRLAGRRDDPLVERDVLLLLEHLILKQLDGLPALFGGLLAETFSAAQHLDFGTQALQLGLLLADQGFLALRIGLAASGVRPGRPATAEKRQRNRQQQRTHPEADQPGPPWITELEFPAGHQGSRAACERPRRSSSPNRMFMFWSA